MGIDTAHRRTRFPRSTRLKSPSRIRRVCWHGRRRVRDCFTIHWQERSRPSESPSGISSTPTRLAFVVTKRLGKAHVRNRIKRRLREAARLNRSSWPIGTDIVIRATQPDIAIAPFALLLEELKNSFAKVSGQS